ncbi:hypothetical protein ED733_007920 [Metarhizium rileyi]|uniref:Probable alpha/beta-glucosidase agdC n=1 Tax=Metarhizium rileyi (strain RCEF 4871) TaxID=1649241 RepID=A0A5C6GMZ3_METRR|nr:hypothetical protein ED733_007920 [Metarhizium rileyi]
MKLDRLVHLLALGWMQLSAAFTKDNRSNVLDSCPGYSASNVTANFHERYKELTGSLNLAGMPCDAYGKDFLSLKFQATVESSHRLHVKIYDPAQQAYQVPESVFPRPPEVHDGWPHLVFDYDKRKFSFRIRNYYGGDILFDTSAAPLVFEDQYIRLRTKLKFGANLYGLGEHSDPFRLNHTNYTRTLWNADTPSLPAGANLYGSHPFYMEKRASVTFGVFLLNSNGMDIKIGREENDEAYLEYNILGGVLDLYFVIGSSPINVAKEFSAITDQPAVIPYSSLGFHQCRWGYQDVFEVAEVVQNYSRANIPLEAMWVDIDYMYRRTPFTLDPERFPLNRMRQLAQYLHDRKQKLVLMVDPAVAAKDYDPYINGVRDMAFLLNSTFQPYHGVVWPGVTAYPDWFAVNTQEYWVKELAKFFDKDTGIDVDYLWIDMNEPSNFCDFPCDNPAEVAKKYPPLPPPVRPIPRELPGWPCEFQPPGAKCRRQDAEQRLSRPEKPEKPEKPERPEKPGKLEKPDKDGTFKGDPPIKPDAFKPPRMGDLWSGLPDRDLLDPPYKINNIWGRLPQKSIDTRLVHQNGLRLFDTHNLYGSMMSFASRMAMLNIRPKLRPFVVTRSTFAGAGAHVAHWLGDNKSSWEHYLLSIRQMLQFNALFQVSMVGSDVCGFNGNTTEELCARWAMLGAFQPFYRNHNAEGMISQEFYRWPSVARAARKAIDIRYRMLDYFYTAMMQQSYDGTPAINPMFFIYPNDEATYALDKQYFWGPALLVAPVTKQGATSVSVYFPNDIFYDFHTHEQIFGSERRLVIRNQTITDIPLYIRGGTIIPLRLRSTTTTSELRKQDFELLIAVGKDEKAEGSLYLDDGTSLAHLPAMKITYTYDRGKIRSRVKVWGNPPEVSVKLVKITIMGGKSCRPGQFSCSESVLKQLNLNLSYVFHD